MSGTPPHIGVIRWMDSCSPIWCDWLDEDDLDSANGDLHGGYRSLESSGRRLRDSYIAYQPYRGTDQNTKRKKDKEIKGKNMFTCCSFTNYFYTNNVSKVSKGDIGLSQD
ncbi:hypothetical protein EPI10_027679 [Gossypium australe]|uniref:Uncharacterized protein n=1 Tax=Gossypium australe TaxID=47621 RepID=A0A5B6UWR6_9ROSI|nr:hypothetical protein EPI10_027679 [Gossypium australe]